MPGNFTYKGGRGNKRKKASRKLKQRVSTALHKFKCSKDDHCETPGKAYDDVIPILNWYADRLGKSKASLSIYDPYFCNGAVIRNFASRGFLNVYNRNEDFYAVTSKNQQPDFDVIVTNPPYSDDHIEKCLRFCVESGKPYFLLLPNYVYTNGYFKNIEGDLSTSSSKGKHYYVIPPCRYQYTSPLGMRSQRESKTSPWVSFWYCNCLQLNAALIKWWRNESKGEEVFFRGRLIGNMSRMPHNMRAQCKHVFLVVQQDMMYVCNRRPNEAQIKEKATPCSERLD